MFFVEHFPLIERDAHLCRFEFFDGPGALGHKKWALECAEVRGRGEPFDAIAPCPESQEYPFGIE